MLHFSFNTLIIWCTENFLLSSINEIIRQDYYIDYGKKRLVA